MQEQMNFIGARVGYLDFLGVPHTGTVVFQKPHRREADILYLGIFLDDEENDQVIIEPATGQQIKIGEYIRSDEVSLL